MKYSNKTKELAKKAVGGDADSMNLLIIELPSGVATDKSNLKSKAQEVVGEEPEESEESEDEETGEYDDDSLKDAIMGSLSDVEMDTDTLKAVCKAIYAAVRSSRATCSADLRVRVQVWMQRDVRRLRAALEPACGSTRLPTLRHAVSPQGGVPLQPPGRG